MVFSRLPKLAVVAALASSIGLHWAIFQSVAWMGMVVNYAYEGGIGDALTKTFDGNHPCALCKEIARSKQSQKRSEPAPAAKKFELFSQSIPFVFVPPPYCWETQWPNNSMRSLVRTPPAPPPRQLPG
jgi:hypothetical protein